jgi:hypothetical protein
MFDQRNVGGPGGTQVQRASAGGTPGKTTLTEQLNGGADPTATAAADPTATAASDKKKGLLGTLHEALQEAGDKIKEKISDKIAEAPEKLLDKLLEKREKKAEDTIDQGLEDGDQTCLSQAEISRIEAALNTTRLIAAFHMLDDLDKATLAEIKSIDSDKSIIDKGVEFIHNLDDALGALNKFAQAMETANGQLSRLHEQAARCQPAVRINPQLKPFTVPNVQQLPPTIQLPPDIEHPTPPPQIHIPPPLIGGGVGVGLSL